MSTPLIAKVIVSIALAFGTIVLLEMCMHHLVQVPAGRL